MLNKKIQIIFLLLSILIKHLTVGLKPSSLCFLKQQECKGIYDKQQNYQTECNLIKCHGIFQFECILDTCSQSITECNEYNQINFYINILNDKLIETNNATTKNSKLFQKYLKETMKLNEFNSYIPDCLNKTYTFESKDFCLNNAVSKCPANQSFICGKYCSLNSIACDYQEMKSNESIVKSISNCFERENNFNENNTIISFHVGFFIFSLILLLFICFIFFIFF